METFLTADTLLALVTLSAMEIVLGIDNIIFITILVGAVPEESRAKVRSFGILLAVFSRLALLFSIAWVMRLNEPLVTLFSLSFSGRDLILLLGGAFLIAKATFEIHSKIEEEPAARLQLGRAATRSTQWILIQIVFLDIIFSLDSVITAVGMANQVSIMVVAMLIATVVMLISAGRIGTFVDKHPTIKILALAFLILIGVMLVMEGMGKHVDKGYIYFAMFFSLIVEFLNMRYRAKFKKTQ